MNRVTGHHRFFPSITSIGWASGIEVLQKLQILRTLNLPGTGRLASRTHSVVRDHVLQPQTAQ